MSFLSNPVDEEKLIHALDKLVLYDKMSWTMLNYLAKVQENHNMAIFRAYLHRLLAEYAVEATTDQSKIRSKDLFVPVTYRAIHHGRNLDALYSTVDVNDMALSLRECGSTRTIAFRISPHELESLIVAINHVKNPIQYSSSKKDERTVSSMVANHSITLINFLEGKKERGASAQSTPAEPVFLTPNAPSRPYTFD